MDLFSRSTSQRSDDYAGALEAVATAVIESGASPCPEAGKEYKENLEPLLGKLGLHQCEDVADDVGGSREQGSSFFQALFNGMNVLAGNVIVLPFMNPRFASLLLQKWRGLEMR